MPVAMQFVSIENMRPTVRCQSPIRVGPISTTLHRDGAIVPWGFRLVGGADVKHSPLTIQKVTSHECLEYKLLIYPNKDEDSDVIYA